MQSCGYSSAGKERDLHWTKGRSRNIIWSSRFPISCSKVLLLLIYQKKKKKDTLPLIFSSANILQWQSGSSSRFKEFIFLFHPSSLGTKRRGAGFMAPYNVVTGFLMVIGSEESSFLMNSSWKLLACGSWNWEVKNNSITEINVIYLLLITAAEGPHCTFKIAI